MHPRNRYKHNKPDFGELGNFHPSLKPHLILKHSKTTPHAYTIDFSNPSSLRELTCAVLARDFGINLEIPLDKLIPTVPQRLNYIHWIEDLLSAEDGSIPQGDSITGIDIGTGASCIYPLLGTKLNGWKFLATEVDEESIEYATNNVARNELGDAITGTIKRGSCKVSSKPPCMEKYFSDALKVVSTKVKQVQASTILEGALDPSQQYDFCLCNPPFFKDLVERYTGHSRSCHRPPPSTVSTGSERETVVEGGEVEFVKRIVEDSLKLRTRVRWYSSMLGKKESLGIIQSELRKQQIPVVTTTEFVQGKTWRWAIAWSFDGSLKQKTVRKRQRPISVLVSHIQPTLAGFQSVMQWLQGELSELQIEHSVVHQSKDSVCFHCKTHKNTWSNQRRKKRIMEKLKRQKSGQVWLLEKGAQEPTGLKEPDLECKSHEITTDSKGSNDVISLPEDRSEDTEPPRQHSECQQQPEVNKVSIEALKTSEDFERLAMQEIESLCTPCSVEFECSILLSTAEEHHGQRPKLSSGGETTPGSISMSLEFIRGDNKDSLHQISQYLKNKVLQHKHSI